VSESPQTPIFFDESRRRWGALSRLAVLVSLLCAVAGCAFLVSIVLSPQLPALSLARTLGLAHAGAAPARTPAEARRRQEAHYVITQNQPLQDATQKLAAVIQHENAPQPIPPAAISPGHVAGPVRAAFFINYEKDSLDSLAQHISQTTHLMPAWLYLTPDGGGVTYNDSINAPVPLSDTAYVGPVEPPTGAEAVTAPSNDAVALQLACRHGVAILPVVQNAGDDDFHADWLHRLLSSPARRAAVIQQLKAFVTLGRYQGINIDFETDQSQDRAGLTAFMAELAAAFHPAGLLVTQNVQLDSDAYDLPTLARVDDFLVPMLYDQHAAGDPSGPIAAQGWFAQELAQFMAQVPGNKAVLGLGNYGYDWAQGSTDAADLDFAGAMQTAQENRVAGGGDDGVVQLDAASLNPYFVYYDDPQRPGGPEVKHTVWLEDATTTLNEMRAAAHYHPLGAALWRLGSEDPSLWSFFGKDSAPALPRFDPQQLRQVDYSGFGVQFRGYGDVLDVVQRPTPGLRAIGVDGKTGLVTAERFLRYPSQYVVRRTGLVDQQEGDYAGKNTSKAIALTFDDGPDPRWTPQILDILRRYHVPATFFVVGENAQAHPGLIQREWNEGMEIGNHSFTHPEMEMISPLRTKLELDATQRVIEAMTGHMTTLFRAPNRADSEPSTLADFQPVLDADDLGYLFIGESNDPTDWLPGITASQIVSSVLGYVDTKNDGNCVLLHDAGGDTRAETVKALPQIIEGLERRGYHFVTVSQLIGRPKSEVFPVVTGAQRWTVGFDRLMFNMAYWTGNSFGLLFLLAIILGIGRIAVMGTLAALQARRERARTFDSAYAPPVSVVIAAYNEAKVINKTVATLLASDYPDLDIVVVDDGSKDGTASVVRDAYGEHPRVTVMEKENGGKASALNVGIKSCRGEIIVALDADTHFAPETVSRLVRHFADPAIGAVSGNVKVGNRNNLLTIWQAVEYITSQNFDRRAFDLLNCITVVPGAVGAWRKDAVILAGLYSSQTLAEDTDLTFKIRKLGYRIVTDNAALAYTEAPDTLRNLAKQRFRWAFGTLQCLWKHRDALGRPRYGAFGLVALPSLWVYQIAFQALAPVVDLTIAWSLFYGKFIAPTAGHQDAAMLLGYWALFSTVELAGAWLAFRLDREDRSLLGWLLLQRFVYRQLMYYVIVKSLLVALRGSLVGWGKFERRGTVQQPAPAAPPAQPRDEPDALAAK